MSEIKKTIIPFVTWDADRNVCIKAVYYEDVLSYLPEASSEPPSVIFDEQRFLEIYNEIKAEKNNGGSALRLLNVRASNDNSDATTAKRVFLACTSFAAGLLRWGDPLGSRTFIVASLPAGVAMDVANGESLGQAFISQGLGTVAAIGATIAFGALFINPVSLGAILTGFAVGFTYKFIVDGAVDSIWGLINPKVSTSFTAALTTTSPIVLDLDGDGIETIGVSKSTVLFDHNGDGRSHLTG